MIRLCVKVRHSLSVSVIIFVVAAVVSLPLFFRHSVITVDCPSGRCQVVQTSWLFRDASFRTAYRVIWSAAGTFVPLTLLCAASAGLVVVLYRSRTAAVASPRRYPCTRVTVTVTSVVLTFIVAMRSRLRSLQYSVNSHSIRPRFFSMVGSVSIDVHCTCLSIDAARGQAPFRTRTTISFIHSFVIDQTYTCPYTQNIIQ